MHFALSNQRKVRYSDGEKRLFALLPKTGRKISTRDLASLLHGRTINGRVKVIGTLKCLIDKTRINGEPFKIRRDKRNGPYPIGIWLEKVK